LPTALVYETTEGMASSRASAGFRAAISPWELVVPSDWISKRVFNQGFFSCPTQIRLKNFDATGKVSLSPVKGQLQDQDNIWL
jgi:hypothetical protein